MSGYPLVLEGTAISAVVVGGGRVATRKALALLETGAKVHVVAPIMTPQLEQAAERNHQLRVTRAHFALEHLGEALLIVVATDDAEANALIAAQARARGRLVNVVNAPDQGNCITPAVHRSGDVVVAVTAGRVPTAAARIRDRVGALLDSKYAGAIRDLAALRRDLLNRGARDRWSEASAALVGDDFCARVESGEFDVKVAEWG
ncbi:MAG TPA: bifunctional precorrin-2 dehydrogenase/sirohydrochlorin ferrochelatase [Gemmatimonadaceae bacterium]